MIWIGSLWRFNRDQEELAQFERNQVLELILRPQCSLIIDTKWIFKNKVDQKSNITRNKVRLVAKGFNQIKEVAQLKFYTNIFSICCI